MDKQHRIHGMSAPRSFTLRNDHGSWWAKSGLSEEGYKSLFKWAKSDDDFWKQEIWGVLEYDQIASDGTPINAIVKEIIIK